MFRGPSTITIHADDVEAASQWYARLLGVQPYFERRLEPDVVAYAEFRIGDHQTELGIVDSRYATHPVGSPAGALLYWHVDDVPAALDRLLELGAVVHEPIRDRGNGFVTASVTDPFGNLVGVMYNPHYVERHDATA